MGEMGKGGAANEAPSSPVGVQGIMPCPPEASIRSRIKHGFRQGLKTRIKSTDYKD